MPTSDTENKNIVKDWFASIVPTYTIDIGCGEGTYSKLINDDFRHGKWIGIEAWGPYVNQFELDKHYNSIIIGQAEYINYKKIFDGFCKCGNSLVIMGDMLEHMSKNVAKQLIDTIKEYADNIIISVPLLHCHQDPLDGNWFETHVDHWTFEEMSKHLGEGLVGSVEGHILGYFMWQKPMKSSEIA